MLKIHSTTHLTIPHLQLKEHQLTLSPVKSENDELIEAIEAESQGEQWYLGDLDSHNLTAFWSGVEEELAHDPERLTFAED